MRSSRQTGLCTVSTYLSEPQYLRLKAISLRRQMSISEIVRQAVMPVIHEKDEDVDRLVQALREV